MTSGEHPGLVALFTQPLLVTGAKGSFLSPVHKEHPSKNTRSQRSRGENESGRKRRMKSEKRKAADCLSHSIIPYFSFAKSHSPFVLT